MFNENLTVGIIAIIIMVIIGMMMVPAKTIAQRIQDQFQMKSIYDDDYCVYESDEGIEQTLEKIKKLRRPKDVQKNTEGNYFLLYDKYFVVLKASGLKTIIEVIEKEEGYRRYRGRGPIGYYWGRSYRNRSIRNSSNRGGGFGAGK